ncbi:MAG TPA: LamG-like jellyroll fold domain-containing protein [Methanosarcina sp.]|nr:LamG-like jellyroll fold domain-containing protein [Methanosarcina sp.]
MSGPLLLPQQRQAYSTDQAFMLRPEYEFGFARGFVQCNTPGSPYRYGRKVITPLQATIKGPAAYSPNFQFGSIVFTPSCIKDVYNSSGKTVHAYFNVSSLSNNQPIFGKNNGSNYWQLQVLSAGSVSFSQLGLMSSSSSPISSNGLVTVGNWYLLSAVVNMDGSIKLFLNGQQVATGSCGTFSASDSIYNTYIGYGLVAGSGTAMSGQIAMTAVANYPQTQGEILQLFTNPFKIFEPNPRNMIFAVNTNGIITSPGSDVTVTGWTATPGPGYASMLNEYIANDSDYVTSPFASTGGPLVMNLENSLPAGSWNIRFRAYYTGTFSCSLQVSLLDASNNVVGTTVADPLTSSVADHLLAIETTGIATQISISAI